MFGNKKKMQRFCVHIKKKYIFTKNATILHYKYTFEFTANTKFNTKQ